jgi:hypothetical protein
MIEDRNGQRVTPTGAVQFGPGVLRRLARLHAASQGAQDAAHRAEDVARAYAAQFQDALAEACEEQGISLPDGREQPAHIDWRTGVFQIQTASERNAS